jgi:hypothetical protein
VPDEIEIHEARGMLRPRAAGPQHDLTPHACSGPS